MKDVMLQTAKILLLGLFVILVWGIFHGSRRRLTLPFCGVRFRKCSAHPG